MLPRARSPFILLACGSLIGAACGTRPNSSPAGLVVAPMLEGEAGIATQPSIEDAGGVTHTLTDATTDAGPKLCGCALCEPIVSMYACRVDADCAPHLPCHSSACVAKSAAVARTPGTMCTQEVRCATSDANTCGCLNGYCSLYHPKIRT